MDTEQPIPDLRDEVEYLRNLVDRLMEEVAKANVRASVAWIPPPPIIIERPTFVPWHQPSFTTPNTCDVAWESGTPTWSPSHPETWCYTDAGTTVSDLTVTS